MQGAFARRLGWLHYRPPPEDDDYGIDTDGKLRMTLPGPRKHPWYRVHQWMDRCFFVCPNWLRRTASVAGRVVPALTAIALIPLGFTDPAGQELEWAKPAIVWFHQHRLIVALCLISAQVIAWGFAAVVGWWCRGSKNLEQIGDLLDYLSSEASPQTIGM